MRETHSGPFQQLDVCLTFSGVNDSSGEVTQPDPTNVGCSEIAAVFFKEHDRNDRVVDVVIWNSPVHNPPTCFGMFDRVVEIWAKWHIVA